MAKQLLFEEYFDIISKFGGDEHSSEFTFPFEYIIIFQMITYRSSSKFPQMLATLLLIANLDSIPQFITTTAG